jgi:hypothetical protein
MHQDLGPTGTKGPDDSALAYCYKQKSRIRSILEFIVIVLMFFIVNLFAIYIAWNSPLDCEPQCTNSNNTVD